jgi:hypothetical protein
VGETRKIAAILVADIVGYSRLAGADEDRIVARLRALRSDLIDPTIAALLISAENWPGFFTEKWPAWSYDCGVMSWSRHGSSPSGV